MQVSESQLSLSISDTMEILMIAVEKCSASGVHVQAEIGLNFLKTP